VRNLQNKSGFTLLALVGILAIMTIAASVLLPNMATLFDQKTTSSERQHLKDIGKGTELYFTTNRAWPPNLAAHAPNYVPLASVQLSQNPRGFPRYYFVHPSTSAFTNGTGLASSALVDARFLLISNLSADAAPTITNATEFDTWWGTAETADLHIHKGTTGSLFSQVTLNATGKGGSYQIDGTTTNSSGGTLSNYSQYHVEGSTISLDEATTYGTPEIQFALTEDVTFTFVPCMPSGKRWIIPPVPPC